jgi:hypothetical protein
MPRTMRLSTGAMEGMGVLPAMFPVEELFQKN